MLRKPTLMVGHPRLHHLVNNEPDTCGTITEYAKASGLSSERVLEVFKEPLDKGIFILEPVGGEIFISTAGPNNHTETPPNIWANLRKDLPASSAFLLWQQVRNMEKAGWEIETNPAKLAASTRPLNPPLKLGAYVQGVLSPIILHPEQEQTASPNGPAAAVAYAGAQTALIVVNSGELDQTITMLKKLGDNTDNKIKTTYLICEAPRYNPTAVTTEGYSVTPRYKTTFDITDNN